MEILEGFIVLEGLDGAGTTTQMKKLDARLHQSGIPHEIEAEPTDGPVGRLVREILKGTYSVAPWSLALLYAADRNEHVLHLKKEIAQGKLVICDRYFYSSLAYQGVTCNSDAVWSLNKTYPHPAVILYVDTPVEECLKRIDHRGEERELFEKREYLVKVREGYEHALANLPQGVKLFRFDGKLDADTIFTQVCHSLGI